MATTRDRFHGAALALVGAAPVKQRLVRAFREHLAAVREPDLPREIRNDFLALRARLTRDKPVMGQGPLEASVCKLSEGEAAELAEHIIDMYGTVAEAAIQAARPPALRAQAGAGLQSSVNSIVSKRVVSS